MKRKQQLKGKRKIHILQKRTRPLSATDHIRLPEDIWDRIFTFSCPIDYKTYAMCKSGTSLQEFYIPQEGIRMGCLSYDLWQNLLRDEYDLWHIRTDFFYIKNLYQAIKSVEKERRERKEGINKIRNNPNYEPSRYEVHRYIYQGDREEEHFDFRDPKREKYI